MRFCSSDCINGLQGASVESLSAPKRIVIKVGSSTLTTSDSSIDYEYIDSLSAQIAELKTAGCQVVLVSSGAIACGLGLLGITERPTDMPALQAAASVGQSELVAAYAKSFSRFDILTSLVLLTRRDTADREAYLHARDTLCELMKLGVVPIVNENDTVSVEQIRFGDNDSLAALVACLIDADMLVIASDIDGLYDNNPSTNADAKLISHVSKITKEITSIAGGVGSTVGSGGMQSKIQAARVLMSAGIPMAIVHGKRNSSIAQAVLGKCSGTLFSSENKPHAITPKKLWIALGDSSRGSVEIDAGAQRALLSQGSSLLSVGITRLEGVFNEGDIIDVLDNSGTVIARGRSLVSSDILSLGIGKSRDELAANNILACLATEPVVHRDEMIVFE